MHQLSISESGHQQLCEVGHLRNTQLLTSLCAPGFTGLAVSELPLSSVASLHTGFKSDELIHYSKKDRATSLTVERGGLSLKEKRFHSCSPFPVLHIGSCSIGKYSGLLVSQFIGFSHTSCCGSPSVFIGGSRGGGGGGGGGGHGG